MKIVLPLFMFVHSFNALAFSEITLLRDFKIEQARNADILMSKYKIERGADRCELIFVKHRNSSSGIIAKSTVLNGIFVEINECYYDLMKTCKLGLTAFNDAEDLELNLTCWNRGVFTREIDLKKANEMLSEFLLVQ